MVELEATAAIPDISIALPAVRVKQIVHEAIFSLLEKGERAEWLDRAAGRTIKSILQLNLNGIGRTDIGFRSNDEPVVIVHTTAKRAMLALERAELDDVDEDDLTHTEYGSIEGEVIATGLHHSRAAVVLKDGLTGDRVTCVLAADIAEKLDRSIAGWKSGRVVARSFPERYFTINLA